MNKCLGCGKEIDDNKEFCERCFQIRNYNNHSLNENIIDNDSIIKTINGKKSFTLFLCDFLNLNHKVVDYFNEIKNDKLFVLTKMDIIPKNIILDKFKQNLNKTYQLNNVLLVSIKNNVGIKELLNVISENREVLIIGPSSSGKSSLINYLFHKNLTVSNHQNTTPSFNEIIVDDIKIIDSPGLQVNTNVISKQSGYLRPIIINLKKDYCLCINDYELSSNNDINVTLYLDKAASYKTLKKQVNNYELSLNDKSDLVIDNIGFIYFKNKSTIFINKKDHVEIRESLVGSNE